jgi:hypothetical protein
MTNMSQESKFTFPSPMKKEKEKRPGKGFCGAVRAVLCTFNDVAIMISPATIHVATCAGLRRES